MVVAPLVKCGAESYVVARTVAVVVGPYIYNTGAVLKAAHPCGGVAGIVDHPHLVDPHERSNRLIELGEGSVIGNYGCCCLGHAGGG